MVTPVVSPVHEGLTFAPHRTMPESTPPSPESPRPRTESVADVPSSTPSNGVAQTGERESRLDPTRYGDWEKNGRCIDF